MQYTFFYISIPIVISTFIICVQKKKLGLQNIFVGIVTIAYSMIYEVLFGEYLGLYYYISPKLSVFFIILSATLIYPFLNMIYTLFLPKRFMSILLYTIFWILFMFAFELISLHFKTIVLTGWSIFPWSLVTYIFTYSLINFVLNYVKRKTNSR